MGVNGPTQVTSVGTTRWTVDNTTVNAGATAATRVANSDPVRTSVLVINDGDSTGDLWLVPNASQTKGGLRLAPGASATIGTVAEVFGYCASGYALVTALGETGVLC